MIYVICSCSEIPVSSTKSDTGDQLCVRPPAQDFLRVGEAIIVIQLDAVGASRSHV